MSNTDLLDGFLGLGPFSAQVGRTPRTVRRWLDEEDGLLYTRIGNRILIHIPTAREWLLRRTHQPKSARRRRVEESDTRT